VIKGLFKRGRNPIGIDFGAHSIKVLQLANTAAGNVVMAAAKTALPAEMPEDSDGRINVLADLIHETLAKGNTAGREVVCCLPATSIQYKNLRLPKMPSDELAAAVEWEAVDRLELDPKATRLQYFDAGEVRQGDELRQEVIMMAVPIATVDEHAAALLACGLRPVCFEAIPSSLARAIGSKSTDEGDDIAQVVLDVGFSASKVLIVRRGQVVFFKMIDIAGRTLDEDIAQRLKLPVPEASALRRRLQESPDTASASDDRPFAGTDRQENTKRAVHDAIRGSIEELSREVGLCLRYFSVTFRGRRPGTVKLVGGEAYTQQLANLFAESGHIQAEQFLVSDRVDFSQVRDAVGSDQAHSEWSVASGLAMWRPPGSRRRGAA